MLATCQVFQIHGRKGGLTLSQSMSREMPCRESDGVRKRLERERAAVILNVKIKLRLGMDEDHIWIVDVAFIQGCYQLEIHWVEENSWLVWINPNEFVIILINSGKNFIRKWVGNFGRSYMNILISNNQMESGEVGGNEVDECKSIFSPHKRLDMCCRYCTSGFEANSLWFYRIRTGVLQMEHWKKRARRGW